MYASPVTAKVDTVLSVNVTAKFVLPTVYIAKRQSALVLKWVCLMGGIAFKRSLVYSVTLTTMALKYFVLLLKSFVASVRKHKAKI